MDVRSSAFSAMETIPAMYTCDGEDVSPPLSWSGIPQETESIVLIADDPDAPVGTWVHWVAYNIPPRISELESDIPPTDSLPTGGIQGKNSANKIGYHGPCPPSGIHRYFFKVHALDTTLELLAGSTKKQVVEAMNGHVLASGELVGLYGREAIAEK
ncbi:MAG: YbhB/YbcL family Raf kinase inhibitor-like protein [Chitinivibrionales bacterium]|nr:YbhB/YbcL family Raf kinase inhibitor-like protein [Chitinivibrionales bacterium]MBD3358219.1 YbhB/YbcL family Raf kinase inhibitor-like protein [Chitinivibrionales bacterium]